MLPTATHDSGAYSLIAAASLFRSSSAFVLIKNVRATTLLLSPAPASSACRTQGKLLTINHINCYYINASGNTFKYD